MISAESKMRSPDRILELKVMDGVNPRDSLGIIDATLFNGGNKLHGVMDAQTTLWKLKYEKGAVPSALKGTFTRFSDLKKHAEDYFRTRNVEIVEVKD